MPCRGDFGTIGLETRQRVKEMRIEVACWHLANIDAEYAPSWGVSRLSQGAANDSKRTWVSCNVVMLTSATSGYSAIVWRETAAFNRETFSEIGNTGFKLWL